MKLLLRFSVTLDYIRISYQKEKNADICSTLAGQWDYFHKLLGIVKQQADSNCSFKFNVKRERTIHAPNVTCTVCQMTALKVFFQFPDKCERLQCWSRDKDWEMAASENLRWGEKAREMPTQASVSECLIVQRDPFLVSARAALNRCQLSHPTMFLNNTLTMCRLLKSH